MTDEEKIYRLTRALEAIAGFNHMTMREWEEKHPDIFEKWSHTDTDFDVFLSVYAKEKLEEINGH